MFRITKILMPFAMLMSVAAPTWAASSPNVNQAAVSGLSDAQIERDIKARLARSPKISLDKFTVKVQGGIAMFEGKTNVIQHKGVATRMAKAAGAKAVVNNIQISDAARKQAADRLANGPKKAQVVKPAPPPATPVTTAASATAAGH
jgi:hypothetical protein